VARRFASFVLALVLAALGSLAGASNSSQAGLSTQLGVYRGSAAPGQVSEFGAWLGRQPTMALDYLDPSSWSSLEDPSWWARAWAGSPYRVVYSVAIIPETGGTLQQGASGAYNPHFRRLAESLVRHGQATAVLRLGWEFNGDWTRWSARRDPAAFAAYWRQIVQTMRSVPGAGFEFDWCVSHGRAGIAEAAYPGNAYVDYVGMDAYDTWWSEADRTDVARRWQSMLEQPGGLHWHRDFARAHGKPMTYPEWGLWNRPDGHGGGDNPFYVEKMVDWIAQNDVAYHMYFEVDAPDGAHRLLTGKFPRGAATFRSLFAQPSGPTTSPPPVVEPPVAAAKAPGQDRRWRGDRAWQRISARR
jgi:hypothetical protein